MSADTAAANTVTFDLDGRQATRSTAPGSSLAELLGAHEGCGEGVCGACTVMLDGVPVRACLVLAPQVAGCAVRTLASLPEIEGASVDAEGLTPLQRALSEHRAFQCGWCVPGLLVGTAAFLRDRSAVTPAELQGHLVGHLCRCSAGRGVVTAVEDVLAARRKSTP